jgi:hypothetical protein
MDYWKDHILAEVDQCHERVSKWSYIGVTRSHTSWEWNRKATRSHTPWGWTTPWEDQQMVLHRSNKITYFLKVDQYHKRVSKWSHKEVTRSHTLWGIEIIKVWADSLSEKWWDHILPDDGPVRWEHQQMALLQRSGKITYKLKVDQCHMGVSWWAMGKWKYCIQTECEWMQCVSKSANSLALKWVIIYILSVNECTRRSEVSLSVMSLTFCSIASLKWNCSSTPKYLPTDKYPWETM